MTPLSLGTRLATAARLLGLAIAFLVLAGPQWLALRLGRGGRLPILFHRAFLALFGVRVTVRGTPPRAGEGALVLANHVSWLDIPVLGSLAPLSFVAKSEIAGWPLVGMLARMQRTLFIDRARRTHTAKVNSTLARRLAAGDLVVLFAEGTTGDGTRVLPFRASLVGAARAALAEGGLERVVLQPLAIAYTRRAGLPVTRVERPDLAWYGDTELTPHVAAFLAHGPVDVEVAFGEPIAFEAGSDRKRAASLAEARVRRLVRAANSGRPAEPASEEGRSEEVPAGEPILIRARTA